MYSRRGKQYFSLFLEFSNSWLVRGQVSMETVPGVRFLDFLFASNATVKVGSKLVKSNDMAET